MSIYRLNVDSVALQQSGQTEAAPTDPGRDPAQNSTPSDTVQSDQVLLSGQLGAAYNQLQLKNDQQNAIAGAIHKTDQAADSLGQKIDALKAPLEAIVKNFPPFSPQDKERMKLLMSYSSIRREIDALTLPPPPDVVRARKAAELPPSLSPGADDSQIADHVAKLDAAAAAIRAMRDGMAADTATFLQSRSFTGSSGASAGGETARADAELTEPAAFKVSAEVGRQFAVSLSQGVTADVHSQFLRELS